MRRRRWSAGCASGSCLIVNCLSYLHGDHVVRRTRAIDPFGPRVLDARVRRCRRGLTRVALAVVGGARVRYTLQLDSRVALGATAAVVMSTGIVHLNEGRPRAPPGARRPGLRLRGLQGGARARAGRLGGRGLISKINIIWMIETWRWSAHPRDAHPPPLLSRAIADRGSDVSPWGVSHPIEKYL